MDATKSERHSAEDQNQLQEQLKRANAGDAAAIAWLRDFLNRNPQVWQTLGNLARGAERAWIELIANGDQLTAESVKRQLADLKSQLMGESPSAIESLLGDTILGTWLETRHLESVSASFHGGSGSVAQSNILLKRLESAQRRHLAALKSLTQLRKLVGSQTKPAPLKVFAAGTGTG